MQVIKIRDISAIQVTEFPGKIQPESGTSAVRSVERFKQPFYLGFRNPGAVIADIQAGNAVFISSYMKHNFQALVPGATVFDAVLADIGQYLLELGRIEIHGIGLARDPDDHFVGMDALFKRMNEIFEPFRKADFLLLGLAGPAAFQNRFDNVIDSFDVLANNGHQLSGLGIFRRRADQLCSMINGVQGVSDLMGNGAGKTPQWVQRAQGFEARMGRATWALSLSTV